jgi:hypothetical protein
MWQICKIIAKKSIHDSKELLGSNKVVQSSPGLKERLSLSYQKKIIFWAGKVICD